MASKTKENIVTSDGTCIFDRDKNCINFTLVPLNPYLPNLANTYRKLPQYHVHRDDQSYPLKYHFQTDISSK